MGDTFGLGGIFEEVHKVNVVKVPSRLEVSIRDKEAFAGRPFTLGFKLKSDNGEMVLAPGGSTIQVEMRAENIEKSGRLRGQMPKLVDGGWHTESLMFSAAGRCVLDCCVTLPDRASFKVSVPVTVRASDESPAESTGRGKSAEDNRKRKRSDSSSASSRSFRAETKKGKKEESDDTSSESFRESKPSRKGRREKEGSRSVRRHRDTSESSSQQLQRRSSTKQSKGGEEEHALFHSYEEPLPAGVKTHTYAFDFSDHRDKNGVLAYLGYDMLRAKEWSNPHDAKRVVVTASCLRKGQLSDFVARKPVGQCVATEDKEGSWIEIDLKNFLLAPNAYTMANRLDKSRDVLKSWTLEASVNRKLWVVLKEHFNDDVLNANRLTDKTGATWNITQSKYYFRYFRVRIAPKGNATHTNILAATCLEMYGYLRKAREGDNDPTGVPKPLEKPVLDSLGLVLHDANEFRNIMLKRFSITSRKRPAGAPESPPPPQKKRK